MISVLQGECIQEYGSIAQLLAGFNSAMRSRSHPQWGGYGFVVVSIELTDMHFASSVNRRIDDILQVLKFQGLTPISSSW